MKTIQFTGTEYEINNLEFALAKNDLDLKTETRVYVIERGLYEGNYSDMSDEDFKEVAELEGKVFSLNDFQKVFNRSMQSWAIEIDEISPTLDIIRFINVKV